MTTQFETTQGNVYLYTNSDTLCRVPKYIDISIDLNKVMDDKSRRVLTTTKPDYDSLLYKLFGKLTTTKHKEIKREITINEVSTFGNGMKIAKQTYSTLLF